MFWTLMQILFWVVLSAIIGFFLGWFWARCRQQEEDRTEASYQAYGANQATETGLQEMRRKLDDAENSLKLRTQERDAKTAELESLTAERARDDQADALERQLGEAEATLKSRDAALHSKDEELAKRQTRIADLEGEMRALRAASSGAAQTGEVRAEQRLSELARERDAARADVLRLERDNERLAASQSQAGEMQSLRARLSELESAKEEAAKAAQALQTRTRDLDTIRARAENAERALAKANAAHENARAELDEMPRHDLQVAALEKERAANAAEIARLRQQLAQSESSKAQPGDADPGGPELERALQTRTHERDELSAEVKRLEAVLARGARPPSPPTAAQGAGAAQAASAPSTDEARQKMQEVAARTRGAGPAVEDDLKKVHGIGPKISRLLHSMGITSFRQVAAFTQQDIEIVGAALETFPGRIVRDDWMSSAREEHQKKYGETLP